MVAGLAAVQVLLALWLYRKLPLAAFTAKVPLVQSRRLPGWALPAAGGARAGHGLSASTPICGGPCRTITMPAACQAQPLKAIVA